MLSIAYLFEVRVFSPKETGLNRRSEGAAAENMYQKSKVIDNMFLRQQPLSDRGMRNIKRSIALKKGSTTLMKRIGNAATNEMKKTPKMIKSIRK